MTHTRFETVTKGLPGLLTVKQAASLLHSHPQTIRDLVKCGELRGVQRRKKQGSPVLVVTDSIDAYCGRNGL